jgi:chaperonin GroES
LALCAGKKFPKSHQLLSQREVLMSVQIRPLYDRLVVRRIEQSEQVLNGIIIPDTAKEKPQEAEVVAVGRGKRLEDGKIIALDVKTGDRILFGKYSGSEIKIDGEELLILREDEVLGVLDSKENGK